MLESLFRHEAVDHQRRRVWGDVIVSRPVSSWGLLAVFAVIVATGLFFATTQTYTRRETVAGYLAPSSGLALVNLSRPGVITRVLVREGQSVEAGAPLFEIQTGEALVSGKSSNDAIFTSINQQAQEIRSQIILAKQKRLSDALQLQERIEGLESQRQNIAQSTVQQRARIALAQSELTQAEVLAPNGFISANEVNRKKRNLLSEQQELQDLRLRLSDTENQIVIAKTQIASLATTERKDLSGLNAELLRLGERRTQTAISESYLVRAPVAGKISGLQAHIGVLADGRASLAFIVPSDSRLQAELYIPTRSAGFVDVGQSVRIEYDAFPYQQFGTAEATISLVPRSVLTPGEISGPLKLDEPVYHAVARLKEQAINTYGKRTSLKPGLVLRAHILVRRQRIIDWVLEPLRRLGS